MCVQGNPSILNKDAAKLLFPDKPSDEEQEKLDAMTEEERAEAEQAAKDNERRGGRIVAFMIEAKRPDEESWDNLLTK